MANVKLSALAAATSIAATDLLYADVAGTSKSITPVVLQEGLTAVGKVAITQPATAAALVITDNKTVTINKSLTLTGTDATTMTFPATSATIARTDAANTFTGTQTFAGDQTLNDVNVVLGTTTGTKLGTAAAQKLGFWNATPVVQQVFATGAAHTVDELITLLQTLGLCKQA